MRRSILCIATVKIFGTSSDGPEVEKRRSCEDENALIAAMNVRESSTRTGASIDSGRMHQRKANKRKTTLGCDSMNAAGYHIGTKSKKV